MSIEINETAMRGKLYKNLDLVTDDPGMRAVFEDHLDWLRSRSDMHLVDAMNAYRFKYDLFSYLRNANVEFGLHWLYMRVNGFKRHWDFDENVKTLLFPQEEDVDELIGQYLAIREQTLN